MLATGFQRQLIVFRETVVPKRKRDEQRFRLVVSMGARSSTHSRAATTSASHDTAELRMSLLKGALKETSSGCNSDVQFAGTNKISRLSYFVRSRASISLLDCETWLTFSRFSFPNHLGFREKQSCCSYSENDRELPFFILPNQRNVVSPFRCPRLSGMEKNIIPVSSRLITSAEGCGTSLQHTQNEE